MKEQHAKVMDNKREEDEALGMLLNTLEAKLSMLDQA